jgi:hypothetical protein
MNAELGDSRPPSFTIGRLTVSLVVVLLTIPVLLFPLGGLVWGLLLYLAFGLATAAVLRGVRREPGSWLGRRAVRRGLVVALAANCAALLFESARPPEEASGPVVFLVVLLVLLNVALGRATQRVATAPDEIVDERQEGLRNRAHRIAYWLFALLVGGTILGAQVAGPQSRAWLGRGLGTGAIAILELMLVLPTMVLAWLEPDHLVPEEKAAPDLRARLGLAMLALAIVAPFLLSLGVFILPPLTVSSVSELAGASAPGRDACLELMAERRVGGGVAAALPAHAAVCWNGRNAYEAWGLNESDCLTSSGSLTTVTTERCSRTTGPDGTLHFTYTALVRPVLLPFWGREVTVSLVVDRNGHVLRFP